MGWINYLDVKQRRLEKVEYYLAQLTMVVSKIAGMDLEAEEVLIDWDAVEKGDTDGPAKIPPAELALALARGVGAIIIDNRGKK